VVSLQKYKAGEPIIKENEIGEDAYFIETGKVEVSRIWEGKKSHLAFINANETFGEMSLIDEKPRSATVEAIEDTTVSVIHREDFLNLLQSNSAIAVNILKSLFERLREANTTILQMRAGSTSANENTVGSVESLLNPDSPGVTIEGITTEAKEALKQSTCELTRFPFWIGRKSRDPLAINNLELVVPHKRIQVSRNHVSIVNKDGRIGVKDRGSSLGCSVNGQRIGGDTGVPGPVFLTNGVNELVLGSDASTYSFKIVVG